MHLATALQCGRPLPFTVVSRTQSARDFPCSQTPLALTGHLVLSTLHTIDALSSISRLTDLGVSPTLIADAVRFVINQRLVRKLCQSCKAEVPETELLENERLFRTLRPNSKSLFRSSGCEDCNGTGFRGRLPIAQIWELSEQSKRLLRAAVIDEAALKEDAFNSGMKSLHDSGIDLIEAGETSVDEVARVNGGNFWRALGNTAMTHRSHQGSKHPITMTEKLLLVIEDESLAARACRDALTTRLCRDR